MRFGDHLRHCCVSDVSLHDLPNGIKAGQVSRSRFQKILDNREPVPVEGDGRYKPKAKYFSEFECGSSHACSHLAC